MIHTRFESIGAYLPTTVVTTRDLVAQMSYQPPFDLQSITGIGERRVHDKRPETFEDSFVLALRAAEDCLSRSRYAAADLDVIISTSITRFKDGDDFHFEPSFAHQLARALGARQAIHFDVSNACAGMMTGVAILDRMIKSGSVRNGIVISGERITAIAETAVKEISEAYDPQFGSLTVGDSGAAVIVDESTSEADRIHYVELMTCSEYSHLCIGKPSDRNQGIALYTDNHQMHKEERSRLWTRFQSDFLAKRGSDFAAEDYDYIIHHQVGSKFIRNFNGHGEVAFGTPMPESLSVVEKYGNTSTTSHFLVLHDHLRGTGARAGAKYLFVPAASGVVTGCVSATISSLEV
ncbi:3-oxoacyl-ACP synthase [Actinoplanes lobatus]|uniref:3-oxoacyl-ACP synthase n=1 Tax=Actinoplanes lobatus TaxID=113568 RepID=A0A7W7MH56_9ACTN|nr:3-oxoacyl-[acyl-carrier-protein] synthase III C-terminal domain-containing protein [Actinoplanes lobatus]MBB4750003.1 3-oxoacyl-[acyl-carrier-protein] synthase-3 [Actinoplanes lobatus]GGN74740.1 3-oxoacyl-ACP synthase [Actinoplanes lobatus]GIE39107.1 3-oxoacyl-ACP synthase [Actinoplanes lobatus]